MQRRHGAPAVAVIACLNILQKGGHISIHSFSYQLFITPERALLRVRRQVDFEHRIGKYHRSHVAAVRHQAGLRAKCALALEQRLPHRGESRHLGRRGARLFGTDGIRDKLLI